MNKNFDDKIKILLDRNVHLELNNLKDQLIITLKKLYRKNKVSQSDTIKFLLDKYHDRVQDFVCPDHDCLFFHEPVLGLMYDPPSCPKCGKEMKKEMKEEITEYPSELEEIIKKELKERLLELLFVED